MVIAALLFALTAGQATASFGTPDCRVADHAAVLALPPDKFDQDLKGGWRPLGDRPGCAVVAADLLSEYRAAHWGTLKESELHNNYWHEGQLRATAGQTERSILLLMAGVDPEGDSIDFKDYALGTIAFLQNDLGALRTARARLASRPEPPGFASASAQFVAKTGHKLTWPPNLDVLDSLIACFGKSYKDAYGGGCKHSAGK